MCFAFLARVRHGTRGPLPVCLYAYPLCLSCLSLSYHAYLSREGDLSRVTRSDDVLVDVGSGGVDGGGSSSCCNPMGPSTRRARNVNLVP